MIGCLTDSTSPTSPHVVRGWKQALAALKIPLEKSVHEDSAKQDNGDRAKHFDQVLELCRSTGTTAMLVHSDTQAVAFVQHCVDRGVDVPGTWRSLDTTTKLPTLPSPPSPRSGRPKATSARWRCSSWLPAWPKEGCALCIGLT